MNLGDVCILIAGIILIPYLYLALPGCVVGATLALGTLGILQLLWQPVLPGPCAGWVVAVSLVGADVLLAARMGTNSLPYLAINDLVLMLLVVGVILIPESYGMMRREGRST
jgi:hypothetical protein